MSRWAYTSGIKYSLANGWACIGGGLKPGGLKVGFYGILKMIFCIWQGYMRQEQQPRNAPVKPTNILSKYTGWKTTQAKPLSHTFVYSWLQFLTTSFSN